MAADEPINPDLLRFNKLQTNPKEVKKFEAAGGQTPASRTAASTKFADKRGFNRGVPRRKGRKGRHAAG